MIRYYAEPASERAEERVTVTLASEYTFHPVAVDVSAVPYNTVWPGHQRPFDQTEVASYCRFTMDEPCEMVVIYDVKPFDNAVVRPLNAGIKPVIDGDTVRFTVDKPGNYILECGDYHNALHIFAEKPLAMAPVNAIVYKAGVHNVGIVRLESNTTIYLEDGAVVYGGFEATGKENIRIIGHGAIENICEVRTTETRAAPNTHCTPHTPKTPANVDHNDEIFYDDDEKIARYNEDTMMLTGCLHFYHCRNFEISGVVLRNAEDWVLVTAGCDNVLIDNVKLVGQWKYNTDGIDVCNCTNVVIKDSFIRAFDDAIVLKGLRGWDYRNMTNITVKGCVVWCDWGRSLEIGAETTADKYENILFEDCDLVHGDCFLIDIQNCGRAEHYNVVYRDIRCEYNVHQLPNTYQNDMDLPFPNWDKENTGHPQLLYIVTFETDPYSPDTEKGSVHDILYENIQVFLEDGVPMPKSTFLGLSADHATYDVTVRGLYVNGERVTDVEKANIHTNEYASFVLE